MTVRTPRTLLRSVGLLVLLALVATACSNPLSSGDGTMTVTATFDRTANLFQGSEVRVLGLPVGEVGTIEARGDSVEVSFELSNEYDYPADVTVRLQPVSLLGERFAQFDPPYTGGPTLQDGADIPIERTAIPAEVDEVLRSFENFLDSLDGNALADLIDVLADTLDGNGAGLNELVDDGAQTVRVLSDSSADLNQLVDNLADLNETLATREDRIGSTLQNTSTVLRNLQEDRDLLIGALAELTRATAELEPILTEHADPLVEDLDVLATTLSTVDRNLTRLGDTFFGAARLFNTAGRAIDYPNARLPLDNEFGFLAGQIQSRLEDRLLGVCLRLDLLDCDTIQGIIDSLPELCLPPLCEQDQMNFAEATGAVLSQLTPASQDAITAEIESGEALAEPEAPPPPPPAALPAPDPALEGRPSTPTAPAVPSGQPAPPAPADGGAAPPEIPQGYSAAQEAGQ